VIEIRFIRFPPDIPEILREVKRKKSEGETFITFFFFFNSLAYLLANFALERGQKR
jgi:hypothetical protein